MPVRVLPSKPNLEHLKYQAKDLLREHALRDVGAAQRIREFHPQFGDASDSQIFVELRKSGKFFVPGSFYLLIG